MKQAWSIVDLWIALWIQIRN